jgi:hypothetical protein
MANPSHVLGAPGQRVPERFLLDTDACNQAGQDDGWSDHAGVALQPQGKSEQEDRQALVEGTADLGMRTGVDQHMTAIRLVLHDRSRERVLA